MTFLLLVRLRLIISGLMFLGLFFDDNNGTILTPFMHQVLQSNDLILLNNLISRPDFIFVDPHRQLKLTIKSSKAFELLTVNKN